MKKKFFSFFTLHFFLFVAFHKSFLYSSFYLLFLHIRSRSFSSLVFSFTDLRFVKMVQLVLILMEAMHVFV